MICRFKRKILRKKNVGNGEFLSKEFELDGHVYMVGEQDADTTNQMLNRVARLVFYCSCGCELFEGFRKTVCQNPVKNCLFKKIILF